MDGSNAHDTGNIGIAGELQEPRVPVKMPLTLDVALNVGIFANGSCARL
jgi:hypothetical protein